jgi:hypothetical protein
MFARVSGLGFIVCGWGAYLAALFSPAIEIYEETLSGAWCFCYTLNPFYWVFAPLMPAYLIANFLLLASPFFLNFRRTTQRRMGTWMIVGFLVSLTSPWCAWGGWIRHVHFGCFLWMGSFALTGTGLKLYSLRSWNATGADANYNVLCATIESAGEVVRT